ncbi:MAG TPA: SDR family oxidoreductase [Nitrososphaerales archaeon]|nr:SDR family oxidoreductase [Nitrososphaerales archaeon]
MKRLSGKYALITGASRGLGEAIARDYAREGAAGIALVSRSAKSASLKQDRAKFFPISADLSHPEEIEKVTALAMDEFNGRLDVLVNNASDIGPTPLPILLDYPTDHFRKILETNLIAPFLLTRALFPAIRESTGSIINVTSDAARHGYPGWGAYGISKSGLESMTRTLAVELKEAGVRVNLVDPGNMNTLMHRRAEPEEDSTQWADPRDVTEVFLYLASDESKSTSGKRFEAQSPRWKKKRGDEN